METRANKLFLQRRNRKKFLTDIVPIYTCLCNTKSYGYFKKKSYGHFEDWYRDYFQDLKNLRKTNFKKNVSLVEKCNSVRRGSKYIKNTGDYLIEVENVSKWFSNKVSGQCVQVLHNINLKIKKGDFVVILGFSGSGKSTLLNVLSGIERPSNGKVIVADHNLISLSERELTLFRKDNLSFIFQNYALVHDLTVRENIVQGAELQENVFKRLDLEELVDFLGIEEHLHKYPSQLSGGQQQRVAIVKSVIKNPKILFADEPTAAVDESTARNILQIFYDINKRYNTTIVLITHNPIIAKMGNKKIHIERGRIIKCINQKPTPLEKLPWIEPVHV